MIIHVKILKELQNNTNLFHCQFEFLKINVFSFLQEKFFIIFQDVHSAFAKFHNNCIWLHCLNSLWQTIKAREKKDI